VSQLQCSDRNAQRQCRAAVCGWEVTLTFLAVNTCCRQTRSEPQLQAESMGFVTGGPTPKVR
jgi:hypothetical protein